VENPWFPSLDHCTSTPGCIGHFEAIYNALDDLIARLNDPTLISGPDGPTTLAALAQTEIFNKLGTDANGNPATTNGFRAYLSDSRPLLYDGTASTYCTDSLDSGSRCFENSVAAFFLNGQLVKEAFAAGKKDVDAKTRTPGKPFLSFIRPSSILFPNLGRNIDNESLIFHEALHAYTGLFDHFTILRPRGLMERLDMNVNQPTCAISQVIAIDVLSHAAGFDKATSTCP
jgi:hypothetical protein